MNRIIKFRAYRKGVNKMVYFDSPTLDYTKEGRVGMFMPSITGKIYIGETEPMQFTGLLDKAGREIYEGDLIRIAKNKRHDEYIGEVVYNDTGFEVNLSGSDWMPLETSGEVIGNIYENPEINKVAPQR